MLEGEVFLNKGGAFNVHVNTAEAGMWSTT